MGTDVSWALDMEMLNLKKVNGKGIILFLCDAPNQAKIQLQLSSGSQTLKLDKQPAESPIFNTTTYSLAQKPIKESRVQL